MRHRPDPPGWAISRLRVIGCLYAEQVCETCTRWYNTDRTGGWGECALGGGSRTTHRDAVCGSYSPYVEYETETARTNRMVRFARKTAIAAVESVSVFDDMHTYFVASAILRADAYNANSGGPRGCVGRLEVFDRAFGDGCSGQWDGAERLAADGLHAGPITLATQNECLVLRGHLEVPLEVPLEAIRCFVNAKQMDRYVRAAIQHACNAPWPLEEHHVSRVRGVTPGAEARWPGDAQQPISELRESAPARHGHVARTT